MKIKVLFLCTGNSSRSQMAEGLLRIMGGDRFEAFSAGSQPAGVVNHYAVQAMKDIGLDISKQYSKSVDIYLNDTFDYVITLCGNAQKTCPVFPGVRGVLHWDLEDPGNTQGNRDEILAAFRRTRDIIKDRLQEFISKVEAC